MIRSLVIIFTLLIPIISFAQQEEILPPVIPWKGKSLELVAKKDNPWITPTEKSEFVTTPSYAETITWFKALCDASPLLRMITVGQSANGRNIEMIIASQDSSVEPASLRSSSKPLLLVQAGIHAGEIDGNTAHTESYVLFITRHQDGENIWVGGGRYIDRLEKRGLISRFADPNDSRVKLARLTAEGEALVTDAKNVGRAVYERSLVGLSQADQQHIAAGLRQIRDNLNAMTELKETA